MEASCWTLGLLKHYYSGSLGEVPNTSWNKPTLLDFVGSSIKSLMAIPSMKYSPKGTEPESKQASRADVHLQEMEGACGGDNGRMSQMVPGGSKLANPKCRIL